MDIRIENLEGQTIFSYAFDVAVYWAYRSACITQAPELCGQSELDRPDVTHDAKRKHIHTALWIHDVCVDGELTPEEASAQRDAVLDRIFDKAYERLREEQELKAELNAGANQHIN